MNIEKPSANRTGANHARTTRTPVLFRFRQRVCVWLALFVALAGQSEQDRLQISISMSLGRHAVQQFETPREMRLQMRRSTTAARDRGRNRGRLPRVAPGRTSSPHGNEVAEVPANIGE